MEESAKNSEKSDDQLSPVENKAPLIKINEDLSINENISPIEEEKDFEIKV